MNKRLVMVIKSVASSLSYPKATINCGTNISGFI